MAKNMSNKAGKQYKEDILFFRMSSLFIVACAAIMGIFRLTNDRMKLQFYRLIHTPVYSVILGLLLCGTAAFFIYNKVKKKDESERTYASINYLSLVLYAVGVSVYWGYMNSPSLWVLVVVTIALTLLYMIYHIYDRDFFLFTLSNLIFLAMIWFFSLGSLFKAVVSGLFVVLAALCCVVAYRMSRKAKEKKHGKLHYEPIYISFLITILLLVLELAGGIHSAVSAAGLGASVGEAFVYGVMFFQYLAGGIYYTIKLIREA